MTECWRTRTLALTAAAACTVPLLVGGAAAAATTSTTPVVTTTNDSVTAGDQAFAYSGTWAVSTGAASKHQGDDHYSSTAGSSVSFRFTGTSVQLFGSKAPHHGQATVQIDGGTPVVIDTYASTRTDGALLFASSALPAGSHVVTMTVKGTKAAAATGTVVSVDRAVSTLDTAIAPTVTTVNDTGPSGGPFSFAGSWRTSSGVPGKYQGDDHYTSTRGSSYSFRFTGTSVQLFGAKAPHHGQASVQVDGGAAVTVDSYSSTRQEDALLYSSAALTPGQHVVKVTVKGTRRSGATGTIVAVDRAVSASTTTPAITPTPTPTPVPTPIPSPTGRVVFEETADGPSLSPYASSSLNGTQPLWAVEGGSAPVTRTGGLLVKKDTAQFHRMFSTRRFGGPGTTLRISYRGRATAIRERAGSSIHNGAKVGLKWPVSQALSGYSKEDPRSVWGNSTQHDASGPGSLQFLTGLTANGYMEMSRNGYGSEGYTFFPNKRVGYTPGTWKDVVIVVEWRADRSIRVRYWHNAEGTGTPVYEATDVNSPFAGEPAFLWLRTDDADFEYDHIRIEQS